MTKDQCVPIEVALKLMDSSSLGLANQAGQFQQTHDQLQNALKGIVNEHHQGFNSSIGTYHKIQSNISRPREIGSSHIGEAFSHSCRYSTGCSTNDTKD